MSSLPERGRFDELPLPRLLLALHAERFEGTLSLCRQHVRKRFVLVQGGPVSAESSRPQESLVQILQEGGKLTAEEAERVRQRAAAPGVQETQALVALKKLPPKELLLALRDRTRRCLAECFGWASGEFELEAQAAPADAPRAIRIDPVPLVREGLEQHGRVERLLEDLSARFELFPAPGRRWKAVSPSLAGDPAVERLFAALDGTHTLQEALAQAAAPTAVLAAWILDAAGALDYRESAAPAEGEASESKPEPAEEALEIVITRADAAGPSPDPRATPRRPAAGSASEPQPEQRSRQAEVLRQEVQEKRAALADLDHYALLGVDRQADLATIKRAYFSAAKRYHPDALARLGVTDLKAAAKQVFAGIAKAYEVLSDPDARSEYDASLDGAETLDGDRLVQAETLYRKGEILLRAGNFAGAIQFLEPAVGLWPEDAAYQSSLGWALFKKSPSEPQRAREHLEQALRLDPRDASTHLRLGLVLRELGEEEAAGQELSQAREIDPSLR